MKENEKEWPEPLKTSEEFKNEIADLLQECRDKINSNPVGGDIVRDIVIHYKNELEHRVKLIKNDLQTLTLQLEWTEAELDCLLGSSQDKGFLDDYPKNPEPLTRTNDFTLTNSEK